MSPNARCSLAPALLAGVLSTGLGAQAAWARLYPAVEPPPRADAAMGFHAASGKFVLFSGSGTVGGGWDYRSDCWTLDGSIWAPVLGPLPLARVGAGMAYDRVRQRLVLFGGYNQGERNDTWEWTGSAWLQRTSAAVPPAREQPAMAYDEIRGVTVLHGGRGSAGLLNDLWEWNGTNWLLRTPLVAPQARSSHAMAFDPVRGDVLLFGGYVTVAGAAQPTNDTWSWNGLTWTQQTPSTPPSIRSARLSADLHRQRVILHGGDNYDPFTWEWDGQQWTPRFQASPGAREAASMAYDSGSRRTVLFGGYANSTRLGDTWVFATPSPAAVVPSGTGCAGTVGVPVLGAAPFSLPWLGEFSRTRLTNLAPACPGAFFVTGTVPTQPGSLAAIGMPGCDLLVQPDVIELRGATGAFVDWQLALPNVPALVAARLYQQGFPIDAGANPLGLGASQRIEIVPGIR